jgi:hypothetical protein
MKVKPINKFLKFFLKDGVIGITLCPFGIYVKDVNDIYVINHEEIHWKQQIEMLVIPFYFWYFIEFLIKYITTDNGYRNISFEKEAYENDKDLNYLKNRKPYSWFKYLSNKI